MGATGSSTVNALAESFNTAPKPEVPQSQKALPYQEMEYQAGFKWVTHYNTRRLHLETGNITPNSFEATETANLTKAK